jgi:hypothetical protein
MSAVSETSWPWIAPELGDSGIRPHVIELRRPRSAAVAWVGSGRTARRGEATFEATSETYDELERLPD